MKGGRNKVVVQGKDATRGVWVCWGDYIRLDQKIREAKCVSVGGAV